MSDSPMTHKNLLRSPGSGSRTRRNHRRGKRGEQNRRILFECWGMLFEGSSGNWELKLGFWDWDLGFWDTGNWDMGFWDLELGFGIGS